MYTKLNIYKNHSKYNSNYLRGKGNLKNYCYKCYMYTYTTLYVFYFN